MPGGKSKLLLSFKSRIGGRGESFAPLQKRMAESRRYLLNIQGLPLFNQATPLNIVIPPMAGPQLTVEVNIPSEYLAQTEFSAPAVVAPSLMTSSPRTSLPGQQLAMFQKSPSQVSLLNTPNPPISSPLASPGQPLNIPPTQLAVSPRSSSPGRQNSLTIPVTLPSSAQRASVPGSTANVEPQMSSPRFQAAPLRVGGSTMILPSISPVATMSPGEAFRKNPTLSVARSSPAASIADVLTSPQMLAPASVQAWTSEPPLSKNSCPSMPAGSQQAEQAEEQGEDEEVAEQATQRSEMLPAMPSYRCPVAQAVPITAPLTPSQLLSRPSGW